MSADRDDALARFQFEATVIHWRGPSPFFFAPVPAAAAAEIGRLSRLVSYGWGMIPVDAEVRGVGFYTALFPKDESYLLPLKAQVRRRANITAGDIVLVDMALKPGRR